jgi:hypothetical protein
VKERYVLLNPATLCYHTGPCSRVELARRGRKSADLVEIVTERLIRLRDRTDERVDRDALAVAINRLTAIEHLVTHELASPPEIRLGDARKDFAADVQRRLEGDS